MDVEQMESVRPALGRLLERFGEFFRRRPTFGHFRTYIVGLLSDLKRKNVEAIALAAGTAVRSLQEFLSQFRWDDQRLSDALQRMAADEHGEAEVVGVIDESAHAKQGVKTPGVARQYCGESGKIDNCVVGVHLLASNPDADRPCDVMLDSDLYLPRRWEDDAEARAEAGIPDHVRHRPKWLIAAEQVERAIGNGMRFSWLTFDEAYGSVPAFWFTLDALGQRAIGEVPSNFHCWARRPQYHSAQAPFRPSRARDLARHSPAFTEQKALELTIKSTTRGDCRWRVKAARVYLPDTSFTPSAPTDRAYWLIWAEHPRTGEQKYLISNAAQSADLLTMLRVAWTRWRVEKWFERAKQYVGLGDFEVRTYLSLVRHWLCCRVAMYFLAAQTGALQKKRADHGRAGRAGGAPPAGETAERLAPLVR